MRMRTQAEALKEIKGNDPNTALTAHALRRMVLSGRIPTVRVGKKYLLDLDTLEECLKAPEPIQDSEYGKIRRIEEAV